MLRMAFVLVFVSVICSFSQIVGVLDTSQCMNTTERQVRALFLSTQDGWLPLDSKYRGDRHIADTMQWTIAFDGKNLGDVITTATRFSGKGTWAYTRERLLSILNPDSILCIPNKEKLFGGWCSIPNCRPLILVTEPNFGDPDEWKPFTPQPDAREDLLPYFKKEYPKVLICKTEYGDDTASFDYGTEDLKIHKSYASKKVGKLICIGLIPEEYKCDGPVSSEWFRNWFFADSTDTIFVGADMTLIDAGDYDGDGESEIVFWRTGYNEDGYVISWNRFKRNAEYLWKYH